jgi:hypothetical protein
MCILVSEEKRTLIYFQYLHPKVKKRLMLIKLTIGAMIGQDRKKRWPRKVYNIVVIQNLSFFLTTKELLLENLSFFLKHSCCFILSVVYHCFLFMVAFSSFNLLVVCLLIFLTVLLVFLFSRLTLKIVGF